MKMLFDPHSLTRRGLLLGGAAVLAGTRLRAADPACSLVPQQEEGPYYVDLAQVRSELTEGKPGVPLQLRIVLFDARRCTPLPDAAVDIWHCDALGVYSGFTPNGGGEMGPGAGRGFPGGPPPGGFAPPPGRGLAGRGKGRGPAARGAMDETRFLRGVQVTAKDGVARFDTLYPGWYAGRTIHIHLKVHLGGTARETYRGGHVSHTGQLFFPEEVTADIAKLQPYANHSNVHRTLHSEDSIFLRQGGAKSMVTLERIQRGSNAQGFIATVALGVDPDATPAVL